jgi:hypothetical protein
MFFIFINRGDIDLKSYHSILVNGWKINRI